MNDIANKGSIFMLSKTITYKTLILVFGLFFIALGIYCFCAVAFMHTEAIGGSGPNYSGPMIGKSVPQTILWALWYRNFHGVYGGPLIYAGLGILLVCFSSRKPKVAYWSLQVALWLIGINLWYQYGGYSMGGIIPLLVTPQSLWPLMVVIFVISLVLIAAYIPVLRFLNRFLGQPKTTETEIASIHE